MTRLLIVPALVLACLAVSCGGNDRDDVLRRPTDTAEVRATVQSTATTEARPVQTPSPAVLPPSPTTAAPANTPAASPATPWPATPATSSSGSGSTVIVPFPFENALQARASLLGTARFGPPLDPLDAANPLDFASYPGWQRSYPALRLAGPTINATPSTVSVYRGALNANSPASATNPKVIAFTTADVQGTCQAGLIRGFPTYSEYLPLDIGPAPCNAQSALAAARR